MTNDARSDMLRLLYGWELTRPVEFEDLTALALLFADATRAPGNRRYAEEGPDKLSPTDRKKGVRRLLVRLAASYVDARVSEDGTGRAAGWNDKFGEWAGPVTNLILAADDGVFVNAGVPPELWPSRSTIRDDMQALGLVPMPTFRQKNPMRRRYRGTT